MTSKTKSVLIRALKGLAATAIAGVATWVASPDVLNIIPTSYQWIITVVGVPGLLSLEKYLGYKPAPVPTPAPATK